MAIWRKDGPGGRISATISTWTADGPESLHTAARPAMCIAFGDTLFPWPMLYRFDLTTRPSAPSIG